MRGIVVIFSLAIAMVLPGIGAPALDKEYLLAGKQAYSAWKQSGTATPEQKRLITAYREHFRNEQVFERNPLDASCGPDAFGYRWVDNLDQDTVNYQWIDVCGDASANDGPEGDDGIMAIPLSFNFPFYGVSYDTIWVNTNGLIDFAGPNGDYENYCPFGAAEPDSPRIAALWHDMVAADVGGCNNDDIGPWVRWRDFGTRVVVEWNKLYAYAETNEDDDVLTTRYWFEAILFANGTIKIQVRRITTPDYRDPFVMGIDAPGANHGLEYVCRSAGNVLPANSNSVNRAVVFARQANFANDLAVYSVSSPYGAQDQNMTLPVTVDIINAGSATATGTVSYQYRTNPIITEPTSPIQPGGVEVHTFAVPITTPNSDGNFDLRVFVTLTGDQQTNNNECLTQVHVRGCADFVVTAPELSVLPFVAPRRSSCAGQDCDLSDTQTADHIYRLVLPWQGGWTFTLCDELTTYDTYLVIVDTCCTDDLGAIIDENDDNFDCEWDPFYSELLCVPLNAGVHYLHIEGYDGCGQYVLHIDTCYTVPQQPCDSVTGLTLIRVPGPQDSVRLSFSAPQLGNYHIWRTAIKSNDGNPDGGLDTDWTLVDTRTYNPGTATFTDGPLSEPYRNYVVTQDCP